MFLIFDILLTKNNVYYIITGSISDGGVWSNSTFADALDHGETKLPPLKMLPGSHIKLPCKINEFLITDSLVHEES